MASTKVIENELHPNKQFLFSVEVQRRVVKCCFSFPENKKFDRNREIHDASMRCCLSSVDRFYIVVSDRKIETLDKAIARMMDENHGVDVDSKERYIKKEYSINKIEFRHEVRL